MKTFFEQHEVLKKRIRLNVGHLTKVAKVSGVDYSNVLRIGDGEIRNPGVQTLGKIESAMNQLGLKVPAEEEAELSVQA